MIPALSSTDTFSVGRYRAWIILIPDPGYRFTDSPTITINGSSADVDTQEYASQLFTNGSYRVATTPFVVSEPAAPTTYAVTVNGSYAGTTGAGNFAANTTVHIDAGTRSGYTFNGWTSSDVTVINASSKNASFTMPAKAVTVTANWTYNGGGSSGSGSSGGGVSHDFFTIKATADEGGTITPSGSASIRERTDKTYAIQANDGYRISDVQVDGKRVGAVTSYTFENVRAAHTITASFATENPDTGFSNPFVDVHESDYFYNPVMWAVVKDVTKGTSATTFSPYLGCTRGQVVTFLYRAFGEPDIENADSLSDVPADAYYAKAVAWAAENGITGGVGDNKFAPYAPVTRAQFVTFLYRAAGSPVISGDSAFTDVTDKDAYYYNAVLWAAENGITIGIGDGQFNPDGICNRAQIVTFIFRYMESK